MTEFMIVQIFHNAPKDIEALIKARMSEGWEFVQIYSDAGKLMMVLKRSKPSVA